MGASESSDDLDKRGTREYELKHLDEDYQDLKYPWFHIVQWASEDINCNFVMQWNYSVLMSEVSHLTENADNFLTNCPAATIDNFFFQDGSVFLEWAASLLDSVPSLSKCRFRVVPSRLPEHRFWERYFHKVKQVVIQHVLTLSEEAHKEENQSKNPETS